MPTAYLGLGANLGDPVQNIIEARNRLYRLQGVQTSRCSSLYITTPVGYAEQPDFINCVVELTGNLHPDSLFSDMQKIETKLGRLRDPRNRNAPRVIDIDLLLFDQLVLESQQLVLPHPRLHLRKFVLQPLLELAPDLMLTGMGKAKHLLQNGGLEDQQVFKLGL